MKRKAYIISRLLNGIVIVFLLFSAMYITAVYSNIPVIKTCRTLWIETAMTTGQHHYLATAIFPQSVIDEVMSVADGNPDVIGGDVQPSEDETDKADETDETEQSDETDETAEDTVDDAKDILGQLSLKVGDKDYAGNTVLVNDIGQGIVISEVICGTYRGYVLLVDDPSRVYLAKTDYEGVRGMRIGEFVSRDDAIAGVNASGFNDLNGEGTGGVVVGLCCSEGEIWGKYVNYYGTLAFTTDNKLIVGNVKDWQKYNVRDGIQFGPALIANGEKLITGSAGYGIHPRTAIGQREDGVLIFVIIDGRDLEWSLGCTVENVADILLDYNAINAGCCDGGASCVLYYNDELINHNSSGNPKYGRLLPNAFLIRKRQTDTDDN